MGVFRTTTINWDGVDYTITPSNELLCRIEDRVCLMQMAARVQAGEPRAAHIAFVLGTLLRSVGVRVTDDEVNQAISHGDTVGLIRETINAVIPKVPEKKAVAQEAETQDK